jgi:hypothetical protein
MSMRRPAGRSHPLPAIRRAHQRGLFDLARDQRFDIVNFEEIAERDWMAFPPAGTHG